jgi:hypothetical protein
MIFRRVLGRGRAGRALAMLVVSGGLGLSGLVASTALPANASGVWTVTLSASSTTLAPFTGLLGIGSDLTATANQSVTGTGLAIEIFNVTTGLPAKTCTKTNQCALGTSQSVTGTDAYVAYVAHSSSVNPPTDIQAESGTSYVTWTNGPFEISLSGNDTIDGFATTVTATVTGGSVGNSPYFIEIFDETTGKLLNPEFGCGNAQTCAVTFTPTLVGHNLVAFLSPASAAYPPSLSAIQASSNVLFLQQILT